MRIGIDIDGVVSDSYPAWLEELNQHFGKNISVLNDYEMHLVFDVPWEDMDNFFASNVERLFMMTKPICGARESIQTLLREGHEVIFVTARTLEEKDVTLRWLSLHGIPYEHVLFSGLKSKVDLIKQWEIEVFIEDYQVNAKMIAESGVPVFLLNASYNQVELSHGIKRCQNWDEILAGIKHLSLRKKSKSDMRCVNLEPRLSGG